MKESKIAGRIAVHVPDHPKANNSGYILKSRYIMERKIGRFLETNEEVHHINGNKFDDREENLTILSKSDHAKLPRIKQRKLNYDLILSLRKLGYGYTKIAKITGYPRSSVRSACEVIRG